MSQLQTEEFPSITPKTLETSQIIDEHSLRLSSLFSQATTLSTWQWLLLAIGVILLLLLIFLVYKWWKSTPISFNHRYFTECKELIP